MASYARIDRIVDGKKRTFAEVNRLESVNDIAWDGNERYIQDGIYYKNIWLDSLDLPYNKSKHLWTQEDVDNEKIDSETGNPVTIDKIGKIRYSVNDAIEDRIRKSSIFPSAGFDLGNGNIYGADERTIVTSILPKTSDYTNSENEIAKQFEIIQFYNDINKEHPTKHEAQRFVVRPLHDLTMNIVPSEGIDNLAGGIELDVDLKEYVKTINAELRRGKPGPGQENFTIKVDLNKDDHNLIVDAFNLPYTYSDEEDDPLTPPIEVNKLLVKKTIGEAIEALETKSVILDEDKILTWTPNGIKADVKLVKVEGSNHVEIQGKIDTTGNVDTNPHFGQPFDLGDFDIAVGIELAFNAVIPRTENGPENTSDPSLQVMGKWSFINLPDISDDQKKEITKALDFQFGEILNEPNTGPAVAIYDNEDGSKTYINIKNIEVGHYLVFGFKDVGATQNPNPTKPSDPTGPNLENRHISYTAINLSKLISPYYAGDSIGIKKGQEISLVLHEDTDRDLKLADSTEKDIRGNPKKKLILDFFTGTQSEFDDVMLSGGKNGEAFSNSDPAANIVAGFDGTYFIYDEE